MDELSCSRRGDELNCSRRGPTPIEEETQESLLSALSSPVKNMVDMTPVKSVEKPYYYPDPPLTARSYLDAARAAGHKADGLGEDIARHKNKEHKEHINYHGGNGGKSQDKYNMNYHNNTKLQRSESDKKIPCVKGLGNRANHNWRS